ncbi:hypothetical protein K439DRAFT_1620311 [Ramaria rubella]|nr:hypothetical protein K439DRAFT_1620311 [Ramaria rubella]
MTSQAELATIIQKLSDKASLAFSYVNVAAFAYDTLLTFPSEVRFIWQKTFRLGTILYLLARYALLQLLLYVYLDFATFPSDLQFCVIFYRGFGNFASNWSSSLHVKAIPSSHLGLLFARAYAISSHNKLVFVVLALLGTTAIVLSMLAIPKNNCISTSNTFVLCKMLNPILKNRVHELHSVTILNGVFTILFDTAVFVAIIENTLGLLQLQSGIPELQRNTLSKLLVQQGKLRDISGILRYGFVLTITLADAVTKKVLRLIIIICRFHLDLQQRNDHPNGSNTSHSLPLGSFHAVKERIHRAVVDEFGDLNFNESFGTEGSQEDIELQAMQSSSGVAEIDLQEFPWAGGDIGEEEAGPVASGSGILRE